MSSKISLNSDWNKRVAVIFRTARAASGMRITEAARFHGISELKLAQLERSPGTVSVSTLYRVVQKYGSAAYKDLEQAWYDMQREHYLYKVRMSNDCLLPSSKQSLK